MKNFENDIKPNISPSPKTQSYPVTRITARNASVVLRSGYLVATKMRLAVGDRCLLTTILHAC